MGLMLNAVAAVALVREIKTQSKLFSMSVAEQS